MPFKKRVSSVVTQEQYDAATAALYEHITGRPVEDDFPAYEYDRWFVLARVVLEGAGIRVP